NAFATGQDDLLARASPRNLIDNPAPIDFAYDYKSVGKVDARDQLLARGNKTNLTNALQLITAPAAAAASKPAASKVAAQPARRAAAKPSAASAAALRRRVIRPIVGV